MNNLIDYWGMPESFSQRHRFAGPPPGTLLRDEVPVSFRMFLLELPNHSHYRGWDGRVLFEFHELQTVVCKVFQVWRVHPYHDCQKHLKECEWFFVYDVIEGLYTLLYEKTLPDGVISFVEVINNAFIEHNIGWQLANGKVVIRGDEAFEAGLATAVIGLETDEKPTAAGHLRSAIAALSARPKANTSGAVFHATNAVECVLGEITGQTMTLGNYLNKHSALFHPALKKGLDGIYGYASDEGARHGKEGTEPSAEDAEFAVATCAAVCTLLARKHRT
jgi:hypothetical protein